MIELTDSVAYETFRENVRRHLREKGISQVELAERTGIPQPHLSALINGRREPRISTMEKVASAIGESLASLLISVENISAAQG